jgi:hypothetical protein
MKIGPSLHGLLCQLRMHSWRVTISSETRDALFILTRSCSHCGLIHVSDDWRKDIKLSWRDPIPVATVLKVLPPLPPGYPSAK